MMTIYRIPPVADRDKQTEREVEFMERSYFPDQPEAQDSGKTIPLDSGSCAPVLAAEAGVMTGNRYEFAEYEIKIGVDPARCQIVLPLGTPGISRQHLRFWLHQGVPSAMDLGSTYGSYLNGERMKPGLLYTLQPGDQLLLGSKERFRVV